MSNVDILELYKQGHSIDYIIDKYFKAQCKNNKLINLECKKIIVIDTKVKKRDIRREVYKIIYDSLM